MQEPIINILKSFAEDKGYKTKITNLDEVAKICSNNNLLPIFYKITKDPSSEKSYNASAVRGLLYEHEIKKIFNEFNTVDIKAILLRGLYLGIKIYKDPVLRPFTDIDILIEKHNIEKAANALKKLGYLYNPSLFPEEFFLDVHLHLVYFQPKHGIPCEIHWAIDHPFSAYDIRMKEIFETAAPMNLEGIKCFDIKPELRFILLLVHIQKHLPYIKYLYNNPHLLEYIVKEKELLHILDAYLFLKRNGENFNWGLFAEKACSWNVDGVMYSTLKTLKKIFNPAIPERIFDKLQPPTQRPLEKLLVRNILKIKRGGGRRGSKELISKKLIFTSKRLPDLYIWLFPDRRTIKRKHKALPNALIFWYYIVHFVRCTGIILKLTIKYIKLKNRMGA